MSFRGSPYRGRRPRFRGEDDRITHSEKKRRNHYRDAMFRAMDDELNKSFGTSNGKNYGPSRRERSPQHHRRSPDGPRDNYGRQNRPGHPNFDNRIPPKRRGPMESRFNNRDRSRSRSPMRGRDYNQNWNRDWQRNEPYLGPEPSRRSRSFSPGRRGRFQEPRSSRACPNLGQDLYNPRNRSYRDNNRYEAQCFGGPRQNYPSYRSPSSYRQEVNPFMDSRGYGECPSPPILIQSPYLKSDDFPLHSYPNSRPMSPPKIEESPFFENDNHFSPTYRPSRNRNFDFDRTLSPRPAENMRDFLDQGLKDPIEEEDFVKMSPRGPDGDPNSFLEESKLEKSRYFEDKNLFDTMVYDSDIGDIFERDNSPEAVHDIPARFLTKPERKALKQKIQSREEWDDMMEKYGNGVYKKL